MTGVNTAKYQLYGRAGTGSDIVRMLLEEIGAPYEFITVGSEPADIEAYRTLTLTDKVPALVLPQGGAMFESAAICIHLAAAHPEARLAPAPGTVGHAHFLQWMVYLSANLYECARRIYYANRYSRDGERAAEAIRQQAIADFAAILSQIVPALSPYVLGKEISVADYYLYVVGGWHPEGWAALHAKWPSLARHTALVAERPVVRKLEAQQRV
jgi:glutathione S-transferase